MKIRGHGSDAIFAYALYYPVVEFLSSIAIALVIWRGGIAVLHANPARAGFLHPVVTLGHSDCVHSICTAVLPADPGPQATSNNILQAAMAASERIFKLLDTDTEIKSSPHPTEGDGSGRIEFRDVWFTYQTLTPEQRERVQTLNDDELGRCSDIEWILRGVSFTVDARCNRCHRRPHRRGQDHDYSADDAVLRRAARSCPGRWRGCSRAGPAQTSAAVRRCVARSIPVFGNDRTKYPVGIELDHGRRSRSCGRGSQCRGLHSGRCRRVLRSRCWSVDPRYRQAKNS